MPAPRIDENLAIGALGNAVNGENPEEGPMARADGSGRCAPGGFRRELEDRGFVQSFSRKGCPCDNVVMESFSKALKRELPPRSRARRPDRARQEIFKFIEPHCNTRRPHSSLGNLSPVEYERQCAH